MLTQSWLPQFINYFLELSISQVFNHYLVSDKESCHMQYMLQVTVKKIIIGKKYLCLRCSLFVIVITKNQLALYFKINAFFFPLLHRSIFLVKIQTTFQQENKENAKKIFLENFIPSFSKKPEGSNCELSLYFPVNCLNTNSRIKNLMKL